MMEAQDSLREAMEIGRDVSVSIVEDNHRSHQGRVGPKKSKSAESHFDPEAPQQQQGRANSAPPDNNTVGRSFSDGEIRSPFRNEAEHHLLPNPDTRWNSMPPRPPESEKVDAAPVLMKRRFALDSPPRFEKSGIAERLGLTLKGERRVSGLASERKLPPLPALKRFPSTQRKTRHKETLSKATKTGSINTVPPSRRKNNLLQVLRAGLERSWGTETAEEHSQSNADNRTKLKSDNASSGESNSN